MRIDAHQHFWNYTETEFGWIDGSMRGIQRDFLPEHVAPELDASGIEGVLSVQARQIVEETHWLLQLASQHDFIRGVVGWVPLLDAKVDAVLQEVAKDANLKGVRHVVHDEPNDDFILREDFNRGVSRLVRHGLVYDILIFERHLPQTLTFVDRHPNQPFVVDHVAKPRIVAGEIGPWAANMRKLAKREHVFCKLSGMVTEADHARWTVEDLEPYMEVVFDAFGPRRLMFGSDWPVCLVACPYRRWHRIVSEFAAPLGESERAAVLGGTAAAVYGLQP